MKTKKQLLQEHYLNIKEISILTGLKAKPSRQLFEKLSKVEDEELGEFRVQTNKVRKTSVLKSQNLTFNQVLQAIELEEQNKNAPSNQRESV